MGRTRTTGHGTQCPSEAILTDFSLGCLAPEQIEDVAHHADICLRCQSALDALEGVTDSVLADLRTCLRHEPHDDDLECQIQLAEQIGEQVWRRQRINRKQDDACSPGESDEGA